MVEQLLTIYKELDEKEKNEDLPENNLVDLVWEDENWNWLYRFK